VYIINAQARKGLGLGFASFLAGDSGQRIVLKDGLLPAQAPTRLIKATRK
jgi:phosphate transport system substrate-binding protein